MSEVKKNLVMKISGYTFSTINVCFLRFFSHFFSNPDFLEFVFAKHSSKIFVRFFSLDFCQIFRQIFLNHSHMSFQNIPFMLGMSVCDSLCARACARAQAKGAVVALQQAIDAANIERLAADVRAAQEQHDLRQATREQVARLEATIAQVRVSFSICAIQMMVIRELANHDYLVKSLIFTTKSSTHSRRVSSI